jgi:hypothetical protein
VNQIPGEECVTLKQRLVKTLHSFCGQPAWLPLSFDMETSLPEWAGNMALREQHGEDALFILKPWNLGVFVSLPCISSRRPPRAHRSRA